MGFSDEFLADIKQQQALFDEQNSSEGKAAAAAELATLTPQKLYQIAANVGMGQDDAKMGELERLLHNGDAQAVLTRLGKAQGSALMSAYLEAAGQVRRDMNADRSIGSAAVDVPAGIVDSIGQFGLGAASLVSPAIPGLSDTNGLRTGKTLQDWGQFFGDNVYSDAYTQRRAYSQALTAQTDQEHAADSAAEFDRLTPQERSPWNPEAWSIVGERLIRDMGSSAANTIRDPMLLGQDTANMVATMGETALIEKGLSGIAQMAIKGTLRNMEKNALRDEFARIAVAGIDPTAEVLQGAHATAEKASLDAARKFAQSFEHVSVGGAVGITEGLGGYQQSMDDVLKREPKDLLRDSEDYRGIVAQVVQANPKADYNTILQRAKEQLAQRVARQNFVLTGAASAAIGAALPEVAHPTEIRSTGDTILSAWAKDVGKESLEEFLQNGTGQYIGNVLTKQEVDPNQDVLDQVGSQAAQSGISAGFSAGLLKAHHVALGSAKLGAEGLSLLNDVRATNKINELVENGPTSVKNLTDVTDTLFKDTAKDKLLVQYATDALNDNKVGKDGRTEAAAALNALRQAPVVTEMPSTDDLPEELQKKIAARQASQDGQPYRVTVINDAATAFNAEQDPTQKKNIGILLNDLLEPVRQNSETPKALEVMNGNAEGKKLLTAFQSVLGNIQQLPEVKAAIPVMDKLLNEKVTPTTTEAPALITTIEPTKSGEPTPTPTAATVTATPEAFKQTKLLAIQAQRGPALPGSQVTAAQLEKRLAQAKSEENKNHRLTEAQEKALEASLVLLRAQEEAHAKLGNDHAQKILERHIAGDKDAESVSRQLTTNPNELYNENGKLSARQYVTNIVRAMATGKTDLAKKYLGWLRLLAESHSNKVQALNNSYEANGEQQSWNQLLPGKDKKYGLADSRTNPNENSRTVGIKADHPNSVRFAQTVAAESQLIAQVHNGLADVFPELGAKKFTPTELHEDLQQEGTPTKQQQEQKPTVAAPVVEEPKAPAPAPKKQEESQPAPKLESEPVEKVTPPQLTAAEETSKVKEPEKPQQEEPQAQTTEPVKPETLVTPALEEKRTVKQAYGSLHEVPEKIKNYFKDVFRYRKDASRLFGRTNAAELVQRTINDQEALEKVLGPELAARVTPEIAGIYRQFLSPETRGANLAGVLKALDGSLQHFLAQRWGETKQPAHKGFLEGALPLNSTVDGKVLNITEVGPDGKLRYQPELIQQAVLAAFQWLIVANQRVTPMKADQILESLNLPSTVTLKSDVLQKLSRGISLADAKSAIARLVQDFWGVKADPTKPTGYTSGIPEAVAAELMQAFLKTGLLTVETTELYKEQPNLNINQTIDRYMPYDFNIRNKETKEIVAASPIYAYPTLLQDLVLKDPEPVHFYDKAEVPVKTTQLGNPHVTTSEQSNAARGNMQQQKFYLHRPVVEALQSLSEKAVNALFGHGISDKSKYNENDLASRESENLSYKGALIALKQLVAEMTSVAGEGGDIYELGKKYQYVDAANNRIMMQGAYNPQASKLMREAIAATWSTLDLSDTNGVHHNFLMLALAQALGKKIHKDEFKNNVAWAQQAISKNGAARPAIDVLAKYLQTKGAEVPVQEFNAALQKASELSEGKIKAQATPLVFAALLEMARLQNATPEERKSFETPMYLEADGMTNGPFNAMGLLSLGHFTEQWVENVNRGGVNFGRTAVTADKLQKLQDSGDLYKAAMVKTGTAIRDQLQKILAQPQDGRDVNRVANSLFRALNLMFPDDVSYTPTSSDERFDVELERGMGKGPMTQSVYGSGAPGVATGITGNMLSEFYKALSEIVSDPRALATHSELLQQMASLATFGVDYHRKQDRFFLSDRLGKDYFTKLISDMRSNPQKFTFKDADVERITQNVNQLLVRPMREGITQTLGASVTEDASALLTSATSLQANVARTLYLDAIKKAVNAHAAEFEKQGMTPEKAAQRASSEFLSQQELDGIWSDLAPVMPMVQMNGQHFLMAKDSLLEFPSGAKKNGKEDRDSQLYQYSRSLDGTMRTVPFVSSIDNPGVAAIPYTTIGMGDARMVRGVYQENPLQDTLEIFDGIHLPVNKIAAYGSRVNQEALMAWQANVFQALQETFHRFANDPRVKSLQTNEEIFEQLKKLKVDLSAISDIEANINSAANQAQARLVALSKVALSFDQMSGTFQPFVAEGFDIAPGTSNASIADRLSIEYWKVLDEINKGNWVQPEPRRALDTEKKTLTAEPEEKPRRRPASPISVRAQQEHEAIQKKLESTKSPRHESGAYVLPAAGLTKIYDALKNSLNNNERWVLKDMLKSPQLKDVQVVIGSPEEILRYQEQTNKSGFSNYLSAHPEAEVRGVYSPGEKTIYLAHAGVETTIHELIHAATYQMVRAYYDGKLRDGLEKESIQRLEKLMEQFRQGEQHGHDTETLTGRAIQDAQNEINSYLPMMTDQKQVTSEQRAAALNEFMSWVLANRGIGEQLAKEKVSDKLARITKVAWDAIKRLIWKDRSRTPNGMAHATDVFSQVKFNTAILTQSAIPLAEQLSNLSLAHAALTGIDTPDRLQKLLKTFGEQVVRHLQTIYPERSFEKLDKDLKTLPPTRTAYLTATRLTDEAKRYFPMSPLQQSAFHMVVMALATEAKFNPQSLTEVAKLHQQFLKTAREKIFQDHPESDDENDLQRAREKLDFLRDVVKVQDDSKRSLGLPVFMALSMVNDEFRKALSTLTPEESKSNPINGLDTLVEAAGNKMMGELNDRLSGRTGDATNMREALDELTQHVTDQISRARTAVDNGLETIRKANQGMNGKFVQLMQKLGDKAFLRSEVLAQSSSKLDRAISKMLSVGALLASEKNGSIVDEGILAWEDKQKSLSSWARELFGSDGFIGRVVSQAQVYDMYKKVRASVHQSRQNYVELIPYIIDSKFSELLKPNAQTYDLLYRYAGRSDLMSLLDGVNRNVSEVMKLVSNAKARQTEIQNLQSELNDHYGKNSERVQQKIDQLVGRMHGEADGTNLLRNAYAIAEMFNEKTVDGKDWTPSNARITEVIDQLATLQYLEWMKPDEHKQFAELVKTQPEAMEFLGDYLKGQRDTEMHKASEGMARFNHHKGELPHESGQGHLKVIQDAPQEHAKQVLLGYVRVGEYKGSPIESRTGSYSYYFSPEGGVRTGFNQGLIQNVQGTAYGVHSQTGLGMGPNAGFITNPDVVEKLVSQLAQEQKASQSGIYGEENLSPVYDAEGKVVAFERTLDPKQLQLIASEQHLGKMIGHWRGRQVEEVQAQKINEQVVRMLGKMWAKDQGTSDAERYDNLFASTDKVIQDAVRLIPKDVREGLEREFGPGNFPVRSNLVNQIVGYRNASIGDMWTGNTHFSEEVQDTVKKSLITIFGVDAYRMMTKAERNWQAVTATVRTNIVVRSMSVAMANTISGIYQLKARGVPTRDILRALPQKLTEIEYYTRTMAKRVQLEAEAYAHPDQAANINRQIQTLDDSVKRLSIWPLIEAGEFSSIADLGQTADRFGKGDGTIVDKLSEAVEKLPPPLRDAARQSYMARDTAIFQGLQKWVQYSDFVMKSIYYDHVTSHEKEFLENTPGYDEALREISKTHPDLFEAQKLAREEMAKGRVTEEFNNYDLPTGRGRGYLESIGLAWFLNYKIRATKIGLSMIRNNPLDLLLYGLMPHPMAGGVPFTDNLFARLWQGSLGHAFGPGLLAQPISWNSWYNLFGS